MTYGVEFIGSNGSLILENPARSARFVASAENYLNTGIYTIPLGSPGVNSRVWVFHVDMWIPRYTETYRRYSNNSSFTNVSATKCPILAIEIPTDGTGVGIHTLGVFASPVTMANPAPPPAQLEKFRAIIFVTGDTVGPSVLPKLYAFLENVDPLEGNGTYGIEVFDSAGAKTFSSNYSRPLLQTLVDVTMPYQGYSEPAGYSQFVPVNLNGLPDKLALIGSTRVTRINSSTGKYRLAKREPGGVRLWDMTSLWLDYAVTMTGDLSFGIIAAGVYD